MLTEGVEQAVREAFYRFLHPTVCREGEGWPLGRPLFASEVMGVLQRAEGVGLRLGAAATRLRPRGRACGPPVQSVSPVLGLLIAGACAVEVQQRPW